MMSDIQEAHRKRTGEMRRRIHDLNATRDRMTAEQRHRLTEFHNNLHHNVSELVNDLEEAHRDRAFEISEHIDDLGTARMKMGAEQAQMLVEFHDDLHDSVSEFVGELEEAHRHRAEDVSRELQGLGAARKKMSAEQQRKLATEHARLEATVNQTRKELRTDVKRAHQVWTDFAAKAPHRGAKGGTARTKPAPAARAAGGSATATADDLTVISGIGPNRQQRLNELGIHSFAQLAHTTEARLRDALGQTARLADVAKWIEEARKRA
jgi:predicted flap endonuclease-1-like 5' DNA nuclease